MVALGYATRDVDQRNMGDMKVKRRDTGGRKVQSEMGMWNRKR